MALGAQTPRRLDVDWAAHGYDDDAMAGLAELVMRVWLSFLQYPANPPRSDDDLREFIRTWLCRATRPRALRASSRRSATVSRVRPVVAGVL